MPPCRKRAGMEGTFWHVFFLQAHSRVFSPMESVSWMERLASSRGLGFLYASVRHWFINLIRFLNQQILEGIATVVVGVLALFGIYRPSFHYLAFVPTELWSSSGRFPPNGQIPHPRGACICYLEEKYVYYYFTCFIVSYTTCLFVLTQNTIIHLWESRRNLLFDMCGMPLLTGRSVVCSILLTLNSCYSTPLQVWLHILIYMSVICPRGCGILNPPLVTLTYVTV